MQYDYLVVGCGFFGSVFAQQARENGKTVMMLDRRPHIGGNCYSYEYEDTGISIHKYGSHIFHCADDDTWNYINRFTEFNRHLHRGPHHAPGQGLLHAHQPGHHQQLLWHQPDTRRRARLPRHAAHLHWPTGKPGRAGHQPHRQAALRGLHQGLHAQAVGLRPARTSGKHHYASAPCATLTHDAYFNDRYQGIPLHGYTPIFERMLEGIPVELNVDFFADREIWESKARKVVYTGPIDRYFEYAHGHLNWRSVRFEMERLDTADHQGVLRNELRRWRTSPTRASTSPSTSTSSARGTRTPP